MDLHPAASTTGVPLIWFATQDTAIYFRRDRWWITLQCNITCVFRRSNQRKLVTVSSRPLNILMLDGALEDWLVEPGVVQVQQHEEVIEPFDQNAKEDLGTTLG